MPIRDDHLIIFDFDGVIVNTLEMCAAISAITNPGITRTEYLSHFEGNIHDAIKSEKLAEHRKAEDGTNLDFYKEYEKGMGGHTPEEDMPALIRNLGNTYPLVIVSSTRSDLIAAFLKLHNLSEYFQAIMGSDVHTSKIIKIRTILQRNNILPVHAVMITDTLGDMREATDCGVKSIGVTWGYHPKETLTKGNPLAIVETPPEIPQVIENYFRASLA